MSLRYTHCHVCSSPELDVHAEYYRCRLCRTIRTKYEYNPAVYNEEYFLGTLPNLKTRVNLPLNLNRLALVSRYMDSNSSLLDIGSGTGEFLRFVELYYTCFGFEPNKEAANFSSSRLGRATVYTEFPRKLPSVDVITLFDVLEHLPSPMEFLMDCVNPFLRVEGVVVLTLPVFGDYDNEKRPLVQWKHWKPQEHLFIFNQSSATSLLNRTGFRVEKISAVESKIRPGNPNDDLITIVGRKI